MNNHLTGLFIVTIIIFILKLAKMEDMSNVNDSLEDGPNNEILEKVLKLKEMKEELEVEINKLEKGMEQQAEITYLAEPKDMDENGQSTVSAFATNKMTTVQALFQDFNTKLTSAEKSLQTSFAISDNLLENKTDLTTFVVEIFKKCLNNNSFDIPVLEHLQQKLNRLDLLQANLDSFKNGEEVIPETSFETFSQIMKEINLAVDGQNEHFEFLEKQMAIIQDSSRTLDDFIIRKSQHLNFHYKCGSENCHQRGKSNGN